MRVACRNAVLGAAALAVLLAFGGTANAASKCEAVKIKCVIKKKSCLLGLYAKQAKTGLAPDPLKLDKCFAKFGGTCSTAGTSCVQNSDCPAGQTCDGGCFTKLEAKVPTPPDQPCPGPAGDAPALESKVDAFVDDVRGELYGPPPAIDLCAATKEGCVKGYDKCVLGVHTTSIAKGLPLDTVKLAKCLQKFGGKCTSTGQGCTTNADCTGTDTCDGGCFTKVEAKGGCNTTGDVAALKAKADAFDTDVLNELSVAG